MASYDWGQSQRGLISGFQLQSYAGEAVPLSNHALRPAASEIEFSDIDLGVEPVNVPDAKVDTATLVLWLQHLPVTSKLRQRSCGNSSMHLLSRLSYGS